MTAAGRALVEEGRGALSNTLAMLAPLLDGLQAERVGTDAG